MRIFTNISEMHDEVKRDLKEMGITYISDTVQDQKGRFKTKELTNYGYTLTSWPDIYRVVDEHPLREWIKAEIKDRLDIDLHPKNPGRAYNKNWDFWEQFLDLKAKFSYTYAERLHPQIPAIINQLKDHPDTRQAILTMYDKHNDIINLGGKARVPCSMYYQFKRNEQGKLDCCYVMRSCDMVKFFIPDVIMAIKLQTFIANECNMEPGRFTHFINSLHAFEGDLEGVF